MLYCSTTIPPAPAAPAAAAASAGAAFLFFLVAQVFALLISISATTQLFHNPATEQIHDFLCM